MEPAGTELSEQLHTRPRTATDIAVGVSFEIPALISSGMRWTLWLSLLALPLSYVTNILLARIGPEALGTFGVLNVYIGLVFVFFFFGGCAVPMKFLPEMDASRRSSFLTSYGLIVLVSLIPWVVIATWRPHLLHFLFGDAGTPSLQLRLIYLSPVCLVYLLMVTSLKGVLEMKWAQILDRSINFGQMAVLVFVVLLNHTWLKRHVADVVWLSYVGLTFFVALVAFYRLISAGALTGRPRFWLPPRFWPYTLLLQANSVLGFFSARLDYILILNTGGLAVLGQYVAITSIAGVVPRISGFVVDSLLPSLTNCLAMGDLRAASRVAETYLRIMFPAVLGLSLGVLVFARSLLAIMGPFYTAFAGLLQIACLGAVAQSLSLYTNVCFTATDRVHHAVLATSVRIVAFACFFWPLWSSMQLKGAVLAWVLGEVAYHIVSVYLLRKHPDLRLHLLKNYAGLAAAFALSVLPARYGLRAEYFTGVLLSGVALLAFFMVAQYGISEVRSIALLLTRARVGSPSE